MPPESLEEVKLLSNLETAQHKLLQIVLFASLSWTICSRSPVCARCVTVVHRFDLQPLDAPADVAAYIDHRVRRAGWQGGALFEPAALGPAGGGVRGRIPCHSPAGRQGAAGRSLQGARQVRREHAHGHAEFRAGASGTPGQHRPGGLRRCPLAGILFSGGLAGAGRGYGWGSAARRPSTRSRWHWLLWRRLRARPMPCPPSPWKPWLLLQVPRPAQDLFRRTWPRRLHCSPGRSLRCSP